MQTAVPSRLHKQDPAQPSCGSRGSPPGRNSGPSQCLLAGLRRRCRCAHARRDRHPVAPSDDAAGSAHHGHHDAREGDQSPGIGRRRAGGRAGDEGVAAGESNGDERALDGSAPVRQAAELYPRDVVQAVPRYSACVKASRGWLDEAMAGAKVIFEITGVVHTAGVKVVSLG